MSAVALPTPSLPGLRQELRIEPGAPLVSGAPSWTLFDPVRHMFFQLGQIEFSILSRWANGSTAKIKDDLAGHGLDEEEVNAAFGRVVEFSLTNGLTITPMGDSVATFTQQRKAARKAWWRWMIDNYLFVRIPLVKPAAFLERTLPLVAPLWSRASLLFFMALALTGLFLVSRQWDAFITSFLYFFSWQGIAAYGAGLFVVKIAHELGHAYTATRFGCRVPSMGISLLVMMPVLYTDTTGAWRLTSRKKRLMIDCAGVTAELMVASISTMLWIFLPEGSLRSVIFILATSSWVLSLGINLNPFMRFDGYYVLSDLIGVPNLQPRSFALGRWKMRELLFSLGDAAPEDVPPVMRRGLILYAWMTWVYRLVLFIGIALLVYHMFFKLLGIILFFVEMGVFVARPIMSELSIWYGLRNRIAKTQRGRIWPWIIGGLAILFILPLDRSVSAPAVMNTIVSAPVIAGDPARVEKILVRNGQKVAVGATLIQLSDPAIERAVAERAVRIAQIEAQIDRTGSDAKDMANRTVLQSQLSTEKNARVGLLERRARLTLHASAAGTIVDLGPDVHPGRWLGGAEVIARIVTPGRYDIDAFVEEADIWRIEDGARATFIPHDPVQASRTAKVTERAATAIQVLDQPILASTNGGDIAVNADANKSLKPRAALYRVRLVVAQDDGTTTMFMQPVPGIVQIGGSAQSMATRFFGFVAKMLRSESSLTG